MQPRRRLHLATLLLRCAAGFALIAEASVVRLAARFTAEMAALLPVAAATQIGGGLLLIAGLLTRWVALAALMTVGLAALLAPGNGLTLTVLWMATLAAVALLGSGRRRVNDRRNVDERPDWRYLDAMARGPEIFK